jgi:hypothetical protein
MPTILVTLLLILVPLVAYAAPPACTAYAAPNGSGSTCSESAPCNVGTWLSSKAAPGGVLCLLDGTYRGDSQMLQFSSRSGTAGNPITVRAKNDGRVLIDGEFQRRPLDCNASYITVMGMDLRNGHDTVAVLRGQYCTAQRVIAWANESADGGIENIWDVGGAHNLLEDFAGWGFARKILAVGARGGNGPNTARRGWTEHNGSRYGSAQGNPTESAEVGYNQSNVVFENIIARRNILTSATEPEAAIHAFSTHGSAILGSIAFAAAADYYDTTSLMNITPEAGSHAGSGFVTSNMLVQDVVMFAEQSHGGIRGYQIDGGLGSTGNVAKRLLAVAPQRSACGGSGWACSELYDGTTLEAALPGKSVWDTFPGVCKRVVNRQVTNEGLWPWPMNERIQAAYAASRQPGKNVTRHVTARTGTIPAQCTSDNTPIPPQPSAEVPVPPTSVTAALQGSGVLVSWVDTTNTVQTGYTLERKVGSGAYVELTQAPGASARSFTDTTPGAGARNCYVVYARGPAGPSGLSPAACVDVPGTPIPPSGTIPLTCEGTIGTGGKISMVCQPQAARR